MKKITEDKPRDTELTINYHTGVIDTAETLEEAMQGADEGAAYTGRSITIEQDGEVVAKRTWYGVALAEEDEAENPITIGEFGFYDDWIIC